MNSNRVEILNQRKNFAQNKGEYVLYWMQAAQRVKYNQALAYAIDVANKKKLPIKVFFNLAKTFKWGNNRNYRFMLEGIKEVKEILDKLKIPFYFYVGDFVKNIANFDKIDTLVMDKGYIKEIEKFKNKVTQKFKKQEINIVEIDTNVVVPVKFASGKLEYAARTIRPKILKNMDKFLEEVEIKKPVITETKIKTMLDTKTIDQLMEMCNIDSSIKPVKRFKGGQSQAIKRLNHFINNKLSKYNQNSPENIFSSQLSPYLHFGQISPVYIVRKLKKLNHQQQKESFIEQLVVRRELAFNFVNFLENYDFFDSITYSWAYETMEKHKGDKRDHIYTRQDYIDFNTHDKYFNAAMKEMIWTGYMHNYMRMYWGKKIIQWSKSYKEAYEIIKDLNNTYFLDGRDPISYASIAWLFGRHDRAWKERKVFGKLRYMNSQGLERKFNMDKYLDFVENLK
ncbi:MAG: deoxyribodipyrimidine photo-lyase [Candidatus Woesearchaeota archaeon]